MKLFLCVLLLRFYFIAFEFCCNEVRTKYWTMHFMTWLASIRTGLLPERRENFVWIPGKSKRFSLIHSSPVALTTSCSVGSRRILFRRNKAAEVNKSWSCNIHSLICFYGVKEVNYTFITWYKIVRKILVGDMFWLWLDDDDYNNNDDDGNNIVVTGLTISSNKINHNLPIGIEIWTLSAQRSYPTDLF